MNIWKAKCRFHFPTTLKYSLLSSNGPCLFNLLSSTKLSITNQLMNLTTNQLPGTESQTAPTLMKHHHFHRRHKISLLTTHTNKSHFLKISFNIQFPPNFRCPKLSLSMKHYNINLIFISYFPLYATCPVHQIKFLY
jgi:hypothetical protein